MNHLLSTPRAAEYCGLSPRTLEKKRTTGGGPPFVKLGKRVRYCLSDLDAWIVQNKRRSTSDPGEQE
ncbi:MAG TPA: helix-turn-helix domain-containing protein [Thermoanaerobaculia bacterium]|nr:helix-turn-helix domain-containing protein [Thermoanaerobaculia bacterium]